MKRWHFQTCMHNIDIRMSRDCKRLDRCLYEASNGLGIGCRRCDFLFFFLFATVDSTRMRIELKFGSGVDEHLPRLPRLPSTCHLHAEGNERQNEARAVNRNISTLEGKINQTLPRFYIRKFLYFTCRAFRQIQYKFRGVEKIVSHRNNQMRKKQNNSFKVQNFLFSIGSQRPLNSAVNSCIIVIIIIMIIILTFLNGMIYL